MANPAQLNIHGATCNYCLAGNLSRRRFKCLTCFDFDLCLYCYDAGVTTRRHKKTHPMQCILNYDDCDLFYGGENFRPDHPQALTCPFCSKMGFSMNGIMAHLDNEHLGASSEVICPMCSCMPGADPNFYTTNLYDHMKNEHGARNKTLMPTTVAPSSVILSTRYDNAYLENGVASSSPPPVTPSEFRMIKIDISSGDQSPPPHDISLLDTPSPSTVHYVHSDGDIMIVRPTTTEVNEDPTLKLNLPEEKNYSKYRTMDVSSSSSSDGSNSEDEIVGPITSLSRSTILKEDEQSHQFILPSYLASLEAAYDEQAKANIHPDRNAFISEMILSTLSQGFRSDIFSANRETGAATGTGPADRDRGDGDIPVPRHQQ